MTRRDATGRGPLRGMSSRATNVLLAALLVLSTVTGGVAFGIGTGWVAWPTITHAAAGLAIVVLSVRKAGIARRGLRRRSGTTTWPSIALAVLSVVAVVSGVLRSTGLVLSYGPVDDMQVHVVAGLLCLPLAAWHAFARDTVPGAQDLDRRQLLRAAVLGGAGLAGWGGIEVGARAAGLPGAERRVTGSYEQGSGDPERMPSIIWLADPRLRLDPARWSLTVSGLATSRTWTLDDLAALPQREVTATIDCTSGWYATQRWRGVALRDLLGEVDPTARSLLVRSVTGYPRRLPVRDLDVLLLATGYEGRPLADRHGAPARLVAPGRRGFWWVKWVDRVEVSDVPWWRQPPFPLQ